jgi:hypothetical protein
MNNIIIQKSKNKDKKFTAIIDNKKINFGSSSYEDYTQHKNEARKKSYLSRHKHDKYNDVNYAGFYSTNLLWNKPTLKESIQATNKKYNVNIKLK